MNVRQKKLAHISYNKIKKNIKDGKKLKNGERHFKIVKKYYHKMQNVRSVRKKLKEKYNIYVRV